MFHSKHYGVKDAGQRPRVPAGQQDGGEYKPGGGNKHPNAELRQVPNVAAEKRARVIYGETSGLRPQLKDPKASPNDPTNWDEHSAEQLHQARVDVGIVAERNSLTHSAKPSNGRNPVEANLWDMSVDAAIDGANPQSLDHNVNGYYLRQVGVGKQTPNWTNKRIYFSIGPFFNVGGGDVPGGSNTYIDFYGKK